jgi:ATP-dependent RNA helicase DDX49/DBP8
MRLFLGGFDSQLATIFAAVPSSRQTLLFTATNSPIIEQTIAACPNNPHLWQCATVSEAATVHQLDQRFVLTPFEAKNGFLVQIVLETRANRPSDSVMIFTKTCKTAELLERTFRKLGLVPSSLHSMKLQKERMAALALFKSNQTKILIATDVASRGLDIPEVELVINHNVPSAPRVRFEQSFFFLLGCKFKKKLMKNLICKLAVVPVEL